MPLGYCGPNQAARSQVRSQVRARLGSLGQSGCCAERGRVPVAQFGAVSPACDGKAAHKKARHRPGFVLSMVSGSQGGESTAALLLLPVLVGLGFFGGGLVFCRLVCRLLCFSPRFLRFRLALFLRLLV